MILLDNEYILIEHEPQHDLIISIWKKYTPSAFYREILIFGYEAVVRTQVSKGLSDLRKLPTIGTEDSYWTVELVKKYYPYIAVGKIYKSAVVLPEGTLTRLTVNSMNEEFKTHQKDVEERMISRYFDNIETAKNWLIKEDTQVYSSPAEAP